MSVRPEDRFKEQKTYEGFESDAKAAGLYDTFDEKDLKRAKIDANYGYKQLERKKQYVNSTDPEEKRQLAYSQQIYRDIFDGKATSSAEKLYSGKETASDSSSTASGALAAIKAYDDSLPGDKSSKYMTMIDSLFTQIAGDKFSYDAKSDPRYALAEEYAQRAMENQMAESALLTGGYGNSYAAASGQQVYTDYMNDAVNDMEDRAYSKWATERDNKYNLLGIAQGLEEQAYNRKVVADNAAKADAAAAKTDAQNYVYDYIMMTGSAEGISEDILAASGWDSAYIGALVTESQNAKNTEADAKTADTHTENDALIGKYIEMGMMPPEDLIANSSYAGREDLLSAYVDYYLNANKPSGGTVPKIEDNPFDFSEELAWLEEVGAVGYEDALALLTAANYKNAEAIAAKYAGGAPEPENPFDFSEEYAYLDDLNVENLYDAEQRLIGAGYSDEEARAIASGYVPFTPTSKMYKQYRHIAEGILSREGNDNAYKMLQNYVDNNLLTEAEANRIAKELKIYTPQGE